MGFTVDVEDDAIDKGEDKMLRLRPEDIGGSVTSVSQIDATLTPEKDAPAVTLSKSDFEKDGDELVAVVPIETAGAWTVDIKVYGAGQGLRERVQGGFGVRP
jgi:hypothetical protein